VLDNFYVATPVWMVDLGHRTTVSGVVIVTSPANPNGKPLNSAAAGNEIVPKIATNCFFLLKLQSAFC